MIIFLGTVAEFKAKIQEIQNYKVNQDLIYKHYPSG